MVGLVELAVLWVVLIAIGALVLGLVGGWFAARRARPSAVSAQAPLAASAGTSAADTPARGTDAEAEAATTDAASSEPSVSTLGQGAAVGADAEAEVSGLRLAGDAPVAEVATGEPSAGPAGADLAATARLERDERARYAEIIRIETENASLRAVAARVPGLERRIRELEAAIDEHPGQSEAVIDLTGTEPAVRPEGADVTRR